jgi:hypothetical protein
MGLTKTEKHTIEASLCHLAIPVEIILGNPQKDCLFLGICQVRQLSGLLPELCPTCQSATFGFIQASECQRLEILFLKKHLHPALIEQHFASSFFHIEAAYALPEEIARAIELNNHWILPGRYPLFVADRFISVIF